MPRARALKRKVAAAPPPPEYTGPLLPAGHVVDAGWWATRFEVVGPLGEADTAESEARAPATTPWWILHTF